MSYRETTEYKFQRSMCSMLK